MGTYGNTCFKGESLDIAITKADRALERSTVSRFESSDVSARTERELSVICESMLPHKRIVAEMLGAMDHQVRVETYGH